MSEIINSNSHEEFDPVAESKRRARIGHQIFEEFMERGASKGLGAEEYAQGYKEINEMLLSRPYKDVSGRMHDATNGSFVSSEKASEVYTPASTEFAKAEEVDEYKSMSFSQLARISAEAMSHGDKTTNESVEEAIMEKILDMDLSDSKVNSDGSTRHKSERDMYYDRIMAMRDKKLAELNKDAEDSGLDDDILKATNRVIGIEEAPEDPQPPENPEPQEVPNYPETPENTETPEEDNFDEEEPNLEISDIALEALNVSRDEYARLSAKRRGEIFKTSREALEQAKQNYEIAQKQANEELQGLLMEADIPEEQARMAILQSALAENQLLMNEIARRRIEESSNKRFAKFYAWFGRQKGFKGRVKQILAVATITMPMGIVAGMAGGALLGSFGGALVGAAIARGVARGLAAGKISKEATAKTLAETEGAEDVVEAANSINNWMIEHPNEIPDPKLITDVAESTTLERVRENKRRTKRASIVGALTGLLSGAIAHSVLYHGPHHVSTGNPTGPKGPTGIPPTTPTGPNVTPIQTTGIPNINIPPNVLNNPTFLSPETIPTGTFKYPWGWAANAFGKHDASSMLETLVKRAKDAGIDAKWNPNPGHSRFIVVNGSSRTKDVVNVLKQFIKPGELVKDKIPSTL